MLCNSRSQRQPVCTCRHILPSQKAVSIYVTSKQIGLLPFGFAEECILLFDVTVNYTGLLPVLPPTLPHLLVLVFILKSMKQPK